MLLSVVVALATPLPMIFQPTVSGDRVAFVHKGDIYFAAKKSGWEAVQLTKTPGSESGPKLSPDGRQVAFLDPAGAVRVLGVDGSESKRLTFGPRAQAVLGWRDSDTIAYASEEASTLPESFGLSFVNAGGGQPSHTGVQEIGFASFPAGGSTIIFSRSAPSTGSQALFQGGETNQIIFMDLVSGKSSTPFPSRYSRMFPHRVGQDLFFVGTEGQRCLNLWRMRGKKAVRVTHFELDGVRHLAADESHLVYEQGGSLYSFDPGSGQSSPIPIRLTPEPAPVETSREISKWVTEVTASPNGAVTALVSRGKACAVVDQKLRRLTTLAESEESHIAFSKDGRSVAFSVETPLGRWLYRWDVGSGEAIRLAPLARDPSWIGWSPTGSTIFFAFDREGLYSTDAAGMITDVGRLPRWTTSYSASHDGRFVAVTNAFETKRTRLVVFDREKKSTYFPSDGRFEDLACAFDQNRPVLYLLSRRQGRPTFGGEMPDLNLKGGTVLIEIPTDVASFGMARSGRWTDLGDLEPTSISAASDGVWLHDESGDYRWDPGKRTVTKGKVPGSLEPWGSASVEQEGSKATVHSFELTSGWQKSQEVSLEGETRFNPKAEWKMLFWATHRFHAEQFYDPKFGGVDWKGVGSHYQNYLSRVTSRGELQSVLSRMMGELVGGHNGVTGSAEEPVAASQPKAPSSGMVVGWDGIGNRVLYVYRGREDLPLFGSVSNPVEGKVSIGDYIVSVDGIPLTRQLGFDQVTCELGKTNLKLEIAPKLPGPARQVEVNLPGRYLRYSDFLIRSEETVDRLSRSRLAYAHIFDTASQGGASFVNGFFGLSQKSGFILDARWNRGGFSNPGFVNVMLEESLFREVKRYGEPTQDRPGLRGPIALLVNRDAVSGGDLLAHAFQSRKIGLVVGTTTSGRTIGIQWYRQLADGTTVRTSESNNLDYRTGRSSGENSGVRPDVLVEIEPRINFSLIDDQLEAAVRSILGRLPK